MGRKRGSGPSSMLITEARAGNAVGIDPHKRTLTAVVVDAGGGLVAGEHFKISGDGRRALEAWALSFRPVVRWGVENAAGWGRHTAIYLTGAGDDVRDVRPTASAARTVAASAASPTRWTPSGSRIPSPTRRSTTAGA